MTKHLVLKQITSLITQATSKEETDILSPLDHYLNKMELGETFVHYEYAHADKYIELLEDDDRESDVVLLEVIDARVIEEDDVGVDHEELLHLPSRALARRGGNAWAPAGRPKCRRQWGEAEGRRGELTVSSRAIRSRRS